MHGCGNKVLLDFSLSLSLSFWSDLRNQFNITILYITPKIQSEIAHTYFLNLPAVIWYM